MKIRLFVVLTAVIALSAVALILFIGRDTMPDPIASEIIIYKEERELELYVDAECIGIYKIGLSSEPLGTKDREGDRRVPEGKYYVCTRNEKSRFTFFLGISYPNISDARRNLDSGAIDQRTFNRIKKAIENGKRPPWDTPLGGEIGIHGGGGSRDWTLGCIAVADEEILFIKDHTPLGTPVRIYASRGHG